MKIFVSNLANTYNNELPKQYFQWKKFPCFSFEIPMKCKMAQALYCHLLSSNSIKYALSDLRPRVIKTRDFLRRNMQNAV